MAGNVQSLSIQTFARRAGRIVLIAISVSLACILILMGVLLLWSPGKPKPFVDENGSQLSGSISEKIRVNINGVEQAMFIKSKDATHPVLLYLRRPDQPGVWLACDNHLGLAGRLISRPLARPAVDAVRRKDGT